ncbi:MAG: glycosyltransferase [Kofleriaceae bacterium]|nr:glycosyltransferase [Kofleriaceae bacterium]
MAARTFLIDVVVVAHNAAATLPTLLGNLPYKQLRSVVVVDRGSTDETAQIARDVGALVLREPDGGYGAACMRAQAHFAQLPTVPDVVVFVPAQCAVAAASVSALIAPIVERGAELALAVEAAGPRRSLRAMAMTRLIDAVYGERIAAVSPVRAIRFAAWVALGLNAQSDSCNVEMVVRSLKLGLAMEQVAIVGAGQPEELTSRSFFQVMRHATIR